MKILHTSDWHLGVTMKGASCEEEQRRFLDWLIDTIEADEIDLLVVSGDIFHRDQPPARALKIYYRFLARCAATHLQQVVITGGNHDSQSRLDAPAEVLQALNVHIVGGLRADEETWEQCLCPVENPDTGEVELVVLAVPYVQEAKLGILTTSADSAEIRRQYIERFTHLYTTLCDLAAERHPGAAIIATGHLTCETATAKVERADFPEEIHQVGTINGLPPSIFDDRCDYVALGHIHRMFPIGAGRAWYCGTPVATSQNETSQRFVLVVDTDARREDGELLVEKIRVPCFRLVQAMRGTQEKITQQIRDLPKDPDLPPYLFIDAEMEEVDQMYELRQYFDELISDTFDEGFRPRIIERREHLAPALVADAEVDGSVEPPSLDELTPEEVFTRLYAERHNNHPPSEQYLLAFRYLMQTKVGSNFDVEDAPLFQVDDADDVEDDDLQADESLSDDQISEPAAAGELL